MIPEVECIKIVNSRLSTRQGTGNRVIMFFGVEIADKEGNQVVKTSGNRLFTSGPKVHVGFPSLPNKKGGRYPSVVYGRRVTEAIQVAAEQEYNLLRMQNE